MALSKSSRHDRINPGRLKVADFAQRASMELSAMALELESLQGWLTATLVNASLSPRDVMALQAFDRVQQHAGPLAELLAGAALAANPAWTLDQAAVITPLSFSDLGLRLVGMGVSADADGADDL